MISPDSVTSELLLKAVIRKDEEFVKQILFSFKEMDMCWFECRHKKSSDTALHIAIRSGSFGIVKALCEICHAPDDEERGNCEFCKILVELSNNLGKKPIHEAAQICHIPIMEYLLDIGANVDGLRASDWTALMIVCSKSTMAATKATQLLLERGASPLITNKDGWTPLHLACRSGSLETLRMILSFSVEAAEWASYNGRTPLHVASLHGHKDVVEELLDAGCFIDPVDSCGLTPFHEAVRAGHIELFRFLKLKGANIGKIDKMGLTCLHMAASAARFEIIEILVQEFGFYVDVPSDPDGLTPLHCAVRGGHTNTVRTLINLGANPEIEDSQGRQGVDFCNGCDTEEMIVVLTTPIN